MWSFSGLSYTLTSQLCLYSWHAKVRFLSAMSRISSPELSFPRQVRIKWQYHIISQRQNGMKTWVYSFKRILSLSFPYFSCLPPRQKKKKKIFILETFNTSFILIHPCSLVFLLSLKGDLSTFSMAPFLVVLLTWSPDKMRKFRGDCSFYQMNKLHIKYQEKLVHISEKIFTIYI